MSLTLSERDLKLFHRLQIKAKHGLPIVRAVLDEQAEIRFVKGIYENFPEASFPSFRCTAWSYGDKPDKPFAFVFVDEEEIAHKITLDTAIVGFRALVFDVIAGRFPGLGLGANFLQGTHRWDAHSFDAAAQMAALGDVIYG